MEDNPSIQTLFFTVLQLRPYCSHTDMQYVLNMSKNVSGKMRTGWKVSGIILVLDVLFPLVNLLT